MEETAEVILLSAESTMVSLWMSALLSKRKCNVSPELDRLEVSTVSSRICCDEGSVSTMLRTTVSFPEPRSPDTLIVVALSVLISKLLAVSSPVNAIFIVVASAGLSI